MHTHTHMAGHMHVHTHIYTHIYTHIHTHIHAQAHMYIFVHIELAYNLYINNVQVFCGITMGMGLAVVIWDCGHLMIGSVKLTSPSVQHNNTPQQTV